MQSMLLALKRLVLRQIARIPTSLPQGVQAFEAWAKSIIDTYDLPDNDSVRFALAVSICHYQANNARVPKSYFGNVMLKGAANQVAGGIMQDLKDKQQAAQAAAAATQPIAEDTSIASPAKDVSPDARAQKN